MPTQRNSVQFNASFRLKISRPAITMPYSSVEIQMMPISIGIGKQNALIVFIFIYDDEALSVSVSLHLYIEYAFVVEFFSIHSHFEPLQWFS